MRDATRRPEQQGFDFGASFESAQNAMPLRAGRRAGTRPRTASGALQQPLDLGMVGTARRPPYSPLSMPGLVAPEDLSEAQAVYYRWWAAEVEAGRPVPLSGDYGAVLVTEILRCASRGGAGDALRRLGEVPTSVFSDEVTRALPALRAALAYREADNGGLHGWRDAVIREHAVAALPRRLQNAALQMSLRHPDRLAPLLIDLFAEELRAHGTGDTHFGATRRGLEVALERWRDRTGEHPAAWLGVTAVSARAMAREPVSLVALGGGGVQGWSVSMPPGPDVLGCAAERLRHLVGAVAGHVAVVLRSQAGDDVDAEPPDLPDGVLADIAEALGGYGAGRGAPYAPRRPASWRRPIGWWPERPPPDHLLRPPERPAVLDVAYFRAQLVQLAALEVGSPALDAYLVYRERFLAGEFDPITTTGEGPRCHDEMLLLHIEALHAGWETQDPEEAIVRLGAIPARGGAVLHSERLRRSRATALADVRAITGGAGAWARTWAQEWLAGHVDCSYGNHPLVGAAFGVVATTDPAAAGRLVADFGVRLRHHPLPPDHPDFGRYREQLGRALAVCLQQWPIWFRQSFVQAIGGRPGRRTSVALGVLDTAARRRPLELPLPPRHELDANNVEGAGHIDRGLVGAVARQVAVVVRAQVGERQPRIRRPPLPEGVGDYLAEALGGYGAGGSPFRDLQRPPEGQFADFAHGAEVTLADIDLDAVARAHAEADHTAQLLTVDGAAGCGVDVDEERRPAGGLAPPEPPPCVPPSEADAASDSRSTPVGWDIVVPPPGDAPPLAGNGRPAAAAPVFSEADMALLDTLVGGPITATELRCRLPGVMIEAALERVNEVALARFGDVAVIDDGATLELNEALDGLVVGGRS